MRYLDLTHPMNSFMPVYPGKIKPVVRPVADIENDGYRELRIELEGHTGTHIDAPAHMLPRGKTLDQFPVSHFTGKATLIFVPEGCHKVDSSLLKIQENRILNSDYLLMVTGWSRFWGTETYHDNFPVLTEEAARWLVTLPLRGIGIDAVSVDPVDSVTWPVHHILFEAGWLIVENLVFPSGFKAQTVDFYCLPLNIENADGAPVRAIISVNEAPGSEKKL